VPTRARLGGCLLGVWLLGVLLAGIAGCGGHRAAPRVREAPPVLPSADELLARLEHHRARLTGLRTIADSELSGPDGQFKASEILVVQPPDRLRIEVLSMFGVVWILATDGEVLDIYSRDEETVYRGRPTPSLIADYLPVPLALHELTELLLGRPPPRRVDHVKGVAWEPESGLIRLTLRLVGGSTQTVWFDGISALLMRCEERSPSGGLLFDLRIKAYREVGDMLVGSDITIVTGGGVQVRLAYAKPELNPTIPVDLFRLPRVTGAREVRLGAHRP
jgi:hypothetical protein